MEPIFTDKQLNNMSREDLISLMKIVQEQTKKKDTEIQLLKDKQKELEFLNAMLSDRLTLAQRKQFGASSEKYAEGYEQMNLFNEAEASADAETEELFEEIRPSSYKRKKRKGKKEEDLSNFETVETRTYKLEGEARYCPECGKKYSVVTKETVKRLRFVPAKFEVEEEITYVYSCPKCGAMKRPEKEPSLIRGSIATPSLVAGIMNAKYVNGMPLARQEREFARYDLDLSTKTMANWIINCADRYLKPLYQLMKEELLESRYIHCDESRIQVLGEPEQKGTTQNWMWVYLTDEFSGSPQMVLFDYERTRAGYHPVNFLGNRFHGYLTCDGYQAYHSLGEGIIISGCLTHARRRFDAALTALKKDFTKEQLKETVAYQAMSRIGILYKIEEMLHDKTPEEKYEERQKQSREDVKMYYRDYICGTSGEGYQSLHITVYDNSSRSFMEVQLRTQKMDDIAEIGPANHLGYEKRQQDERARRDVIPEGECVYFDEAYERGMKLLSLELADLDVNMFSAVNNSLINDGCGLFRGRLILPYEHLSRFQNDVID